MKWIGAWLAILVTGMLLTGCGSTSTKFYNYATKVPPPAGDMARIWFYRPIVMSASTNLPPVKVDGVTVGTSMPGKFFYADIAPGRHKISTDPDGKKVIYVNISTSADTFVECNISPQMVSRIVPTWMNESDGRRAIDDLRFGK